MNTIQNLTGAVVADAPWLDPRGNVTALLDEPQPGYLRKIHLTGAGLTVESGPVRIGIPLTDILKLVEQCEPGLIPPPPVPAAARSAMTAAAAKLFKP